MSLLPHSKRSGALPSGASLRKAGLLWCLAHAPLVFALFAGPLAAAVQTLPEPYRWPMWPAAIVEAATIAVAIWLVTLPSSLVRPLYRWLLPLVTGLGTFALVIDAIVYRLVGFHVNAFFFKVLVQPGSLAETGVRPWHAAGLLLAGFAWLAVELKGFGALARRTSGEGRAWRWALALLLLGVGERFAVATLAYFGGPAVFAAGQVLPLQAPVRMNSFLAGLLGHESFRMRDPFSGAAREQAGKVPRGIDPSQVRFDRTPDVVFVLAESFRADYFEPRTMPRLTARAAAEGAAFERHYASASNTFHGVFSLLFSLTANKAEAVVGSGRSPVIFDAFAANGYQQHLVLASSADWMGLKQSVFGKVANELESEWGGPHHLKDDELMRRSKRWVSAADPSKPIFLFVFMLGTHFDYMYPPRSEVFSPAWDGSGSIKATTAPGEHIKNRGRNAAHEIDWKVDELLAFVEAKRGRRPLVVFTGDHGEEFREHGRVGHASGVNLEQVAVPLVFTGEGVPRGRFDQPTSHVDVVPTLLRLLGDHHPPEAYSDGLYAFEAPKDRYVLTTIGWEPTYAAIGHDTKVVFSALDTGFGTAKVTDPFDRPVPDAEKRFAEVAPKILGMLGRASK